jgi:hypothetical protein
MVAFDLFDRSSTAELQARLTSLIRKTQPFAKKIAHRGVWVEPSVLADRISGEVGRRQSAAPVL